MNGEDWSAPRGEPGVRRNALSAPHWTAVADVDPRVADALLSALEDAGVAAYAEPVGADTDRVYVDESRHDVALAVVAAELPGLLGELEPDPDDPENPSAFDAIVAGWDVEPDLPTWPAEEDVDRTARRRARAEQDAEPAEPAAYQPAEYDEGHYVPPPPPPVPEAHPVTRWAAIAIGFGLLLLVGLPLLATEPSQSAQVLGVLAIIGGIGTLVWRLRDGPSVDDGPDDGAVL